MGDSREEARIARGTRRVAALTLALVVLCAVLVWALGNVRALHPVGPAGFVALIVLFAIAEVVVIHIPVRRDTHTASFNEVPLTIALFVLSGPQLLSAAVAGTFVSLWFRRRQRGVKLAFNLAQVGTQSILAVATFHALLGHQAIGSWRTAAASGVAVLAADFWSAALVSVAIGLFREQRPHLGAFELFGGFVSAAAKTAVALLAVGALNDNSPAELIMVAICTVTMYLAFRAYAALHERHVRLEMLYRFSSALNGRVQLDEIAVTVVDEARDILRAQSAELLLIDANGSTSRWSTVEGEPTTFTDTAPTAIASNNGALVTTDELLAANFELHSGTNASLRVSDRLGVDGSFDRVDGRMFEGLVNQAAIALANGELAQQLEDEMRERAERAARDQLTGLLNLGAFTEVLESELQSHNNERVLFVLGLDNFSEINETLGHDNGDVVLRELADRLAHAVQGSIVARLGGDELAVLVACEPDTDLRVMGHDFAASLRRPLSIDGLRLEVAASVGAACAPQHATNAIALLRFANTAMRKAKATRTSFDIYEPADEIDTRRQLMLAHEMRRAIGGDQFVVYYQPKIALRSRSVLGMEALVRWQHPKLGLLAPDEFIPIAENTGLINELTDFVLNQALRQRRVWFESGHELTMAVNISARSLAVQGFADRVARALVRHRCSPEALTLELTESQLMADSDRAALALSELHDLGVRISIDDFGTGFSSLSRLRALPLDELKIDKSFVFGVTQNESDAAIVRSITALAATLGLHVVAEGVEDEATAEFLRGCDVPTIQGFLYGRPQPPHYFAASITNVSATLSVTTD